MNFYVKVFGLGKFLLLESQLWSKITHVCDVCGVHKWIICVECMCVHGGVHVHVCACEGLVRV